MKVVALVPIKLNSQRLPHKNILPILGKPMCYHIVDSLVQAEGIDEVYVYCSDPKVTEYIPEQAQFLQRDKKLDGDFVKGFDIYRSFIETVDADVYVLARYNAQAEHPGIDIYYIKDCEVSKSLIENGDFVNIPDNLYDILSELGLYTE